MSGGTFDYSQRRIEEIADEIEFGLDRQGKLDKDESEWIKRPTWFRAFSPEVEAKLREGVKILRQAYVYAQRADWLFADDDGEETFLERLNNDLKKLDDEKPNDL